MKSKKKKLIKIITIFVVSVISSYETQTTNMVRPLTTQPIIKFENYSSIYLNVNRSTIFVGTYFHQSPSERVDTIYGSSGINSLNTNTSLPYKDIFQFTDLSVSGLGGPYKVGFLLTYENSVGKRFCIATISNQDIFVNPVLYVIYSSWVVWTGFGLFIGSFFFIIIFSCICFPLKNQRKFYGYFMIGKSFQKEYGTSRKKKEKRENFNFFFFFRCRNSL